MREREREGENKWVWLFHRYTYIITKKKAFCGKITNSKTRSLSLLENINLNFNSIHFREQSIEKGIRVTTDIYEIEQRAETHCIPGQPPDRWRTGWVYIRDIDVPHSAGAKRVRGVEGSISRAEEDEKWEKEGTQHLALWRPAFSGASVRGWTGVTAQSADASSCVIVDGWCTESRINLGWPRRRRNMWRYATHEPADKSQKSSISLI